MSDVYFDDDDGVWYRVPDDEEMRELAGQQYGREGECEIDDDAVISRGEDNGAYVQAWVWVEYPETQDPNDSEEDDDE